MIKVSYSGMAKAYASRGAVLEPFEGVVTLVPPYDRKMYSEAAIKSFLAKRFLVDHLSKELGMNVNNIKQVYLEDEQEEIDNICPLVGKDVMKLSHPELQMVSLKYGAYGVPLPRSQSLRDARRSTVTALLKVLEDKTLKDAGITKVNAKDDTEFEDWEGYSYILPTKIPRDTAKSEGLVAEKKTTEKKTKEKTNPAPAVDDFLDNIA